MTPIIKILPPTLANKIAAGEVVQRPASAVKELLENAIDAGASSITVIIKEGGKSLIQVIDDGSGMSAEDALLAFQRHATSKIATYEDLENIRTLGFRGEALASIAAVAQIEIRTRLSAHAVGTKIRMEGGIVKETGEDATPVGTSITVKNLFFNTPARRNFLKSNNTEFKHLFDVFQRVAISHPEKTLKFISDDEMILHLLPITAVGRIKDVFGERVSQGIFSFEESSEFLSITGFLGKPEYARKTRFEQYLFLNNRFVLNRNINHAVFQAYEHLLEKGSFPLFVLFLTIDPHRVDVNVHPSKMEVKFDDDSAVYRFVLSSVRKALSSHDLVPDAGVREESSADDRLGLRFRQPVVASGQRVAQWQELLRTPISPATSLDGIFAQPDQTGATVAVDDSPETKFALTAVALWQIHNKYILVPIESGVMIVDQHAAHERVLYERAVARYKNAATQSQQLLFPHSVEMTSGEVALVRQILPDLEGLGFGVRIFGKTTIIVDGVPVDVKPGKEATILPEIIDLFKEDEQAVRLQPRERLAKVYSCKAAIKAGDPLNNPEMHSLLDQLFSTEIPYVCPHGRPVIVKLSIAELDRRFGRTPA